MLIELKRYSKSYIPLWSKRRKKELDLYKALQKSVVD
ncbi:hypothetical protein PFDG_01830 [Plasmodium falciparum Dd2]|uniref:Uncharacterized protein n=1 Tax=Plasmodium falciparum (isolate Dd2) TaxID=57267 RepID=A0A0L7M1F6_PLAF4|nr:hypothetical protein PFDG_01830 [Plasmodium falciparum Dd2]